MYEQYEFLRASYIEKTNEIHRWEILFDDKKEIIEIERKTDSARFDFLNFMGKEGWQYVTRNIDNYDYLQRKKESIMNMD